MHCTQPFNISANFGPIIGGQTVRPTISAILAAEPRLQLILDQASAARRFSGRARLLAYSRLKRDASRLVGWWAANPQVGQAEHYDAFLRALAGRLGL